jgi:hypothetical protein
MNADQEKAKPTTEIRRHREEGKTEKTFETQRNGGAEENDFLAISSDSADIRVDPRLGLASFSDVCDDARCRRFLERFDGLNDHSIDFTRLRKSRQVARESCDRRVRQ